MWIEDVFGHWHRHHKICHFMVTDDGFSLPTFDNKHMYETKCFIVGITDEGRVVFLELIREGVVLKTRLDDYLECLESSLRDESVAKFPCGTLLDTGESLSS